MLSGPDDPRHGTGNGYRNHGCRCQRCRDANAADMRVYNTGENKARRLKRLREIYAELRAQGLTPDEARRRSQLRQVPKAPRKSAVLRAERAAERKLLEGSDVDLKPGFAYHSAEVSQTPRHGWHAACKSCGWQGPNRLEKKDANDDCFEHDLAENLFDHD